MKIRLVTDEKIAETSSKGNQEKWYDQASNCWYKLDQFEYEALAETVISAFLEQSSIETDTPFTFVRYQMERLQVHGRERTGCSSKNFLRPLLNYYPQRDRGVIAERVEVCILTRQKKL